ncbi:hypothetical protein YM3MPS_03200 [Mycobacterium pseudoshottsii]|nr:hypothetical protein DL240490_02304 [Mycobacterium marinum]BEH74517.1 hypothetical protein YM3MPS_03200 [Mycobacterium pseudoshottsii]
MPQGIGVTEAKIFYPTKGTTPARGEAEVVVLQPRGVGLMHPRLMAE